MAGVQADAVIVRLEAQITKYNADMEAAAKKTEAVFARIRDAEKGGTSGGQSVSAKRAKDDAVTVEKAANRKATAEEKAAQRAIVAAEKKTEKEREANEKAAAKAEELANRKAAKEEAAQARITAAVEKGVAARNAAEAKSFAGGGSGGSRSLAGAQTRLMGGTSLSAVSSAPIKDNVNYLLRDQIDLQTKLGAAITAGDRAAQSSLQDQITYLRLISQYKRAGLSDTQAEARAEQGLIAIVDARADAEARAGNQATAVSGRVANAQRNLGRQFSDIGASLASGASPAVIFAQQISQIVDALADLNGGATDAKAAGNSIAQTSTKASASLAGLSSTTNAARTATLQLGAADVAAVPPTAALSAAARGEAAAVATIVPAATAAAAATETLTVANTAAAGSTVAAAGAGARAAAFFAGPWGAALLAAGTVAAVFGAKLFETGESVDDLVEKLRKQADESRKNTQAQDIFARSVEGVTHAVNEQAKAIKDANATQADTRNRALALALAQDQIAKSTRDATKAQLEKAVVDARIARDAAQLNAGADESGASAREARKAEANVRRLEGELAAANAAIATAQSNIRNRQADIVNARVEASLDPATAATERYTNALAKLQKQFAAKEFGSAEYEKRRAVLAAERNKALRDIQEAEKNANAAGRGNSIILGAPVQGGRVTSGIGRRDAPTRGASTNHPGIDIAAAAGSPVRAGASGVVIHAGRLGGLGNAVVVDYGGGTIAKYGHLSQVLTQRGNRVNAGEQIGAVGSTGRSTGNHLHYEVRTNGKVVDPNGRVRVGNQDAAVARDAAQEQRDAERLAKETRQNEQDYQSEVLRLNNAILSAKGRQAQSIEDVYNAEIAEADAAQAELVLKYEGLQADGRINEEKKKFLIALGVQLSAQAKVNAALDKQAALSDQILQRQADAADAQVRGARIELSTARTRADRIKGEEKLIDAEHEAQRAELARRYGNAVPGSADSDRIEGELRDLDADRNAKKNNLRYDNRSSYDKYRDNLDDVDSLADDIDGIKIQTLEAVTDELTNATKAALGLKGAFGDIVGELIRIGIQRKLIGPLADALFGKETGSGAGSSGGGTGGFLGSFLGTIAKSFAGGRASGGNVSAGQMYRVNELGVEGFQPAQSGKIIPLGRMNPAAGGNTTIVQQSFVLDARYGITTPQLIDYVNRTASRKAAEAGRAAYQASPARSQQLEQLGT